MPGKKLSKLQKAKQAALAIQRQKTREQAEKARDKKAKKLKKLRSRALPCKCVSSPGVLHKNPGMARAIAVVGVRPHQVHLMDAGARFQDSVYGEGKRLHNPSFVKGKFNGWTCTVCGTLKKE